MKKSLEEREEYWMKVSDSRVDLRMTHFDVKRVFAEDAETIVMEGMGIKLMEKLARISRGLFNPIDIREKWREWKGRLPPETTPQVKEYFDRDHGLWSKRSVSFKFKNEEHAVDFYCEGDYLLIDLAVKKINELIKDTGYQYYWLHDTGYIAYIVLSEDEAEKLRERCWKLSSL